MASPGSQAVILAHSQLVYSNISMCITAKAEGYQDIIEKTTVIATSPTKEDIEMQNPGVEKWCVVKHNWREQVLMALQRWQPLVPV